MPLIYIMASGVLSGTKVLVGDNDLKSQLKARGFGELEGNALILSMIEAAYLLENDKLDVVSGDSSIGFQGLVSIASGVEGEFLNKYLVYKDLRGRGMVVRSGLKFGTDFRLYDRGASVGRDHSNYLVHVVPEEYTCSFPEMARALRLAKNVNKSMIYAIVDGESDITYYLIDRMRL
jgi:tRNA-intron endonuclease, archaea type